MARWTASPKTVVPHIGTNNTGDRQDEPEVTAAGIRAIVQELRQRLPGARILVLSIFRATSYPTATSGAEMRSSTP